MRTLILFALALSATAVLTDDASAIGKRKRGASSGCGGCGTPAVAPAPCGGCSSGAPVYKGAPGTGRVGYGMQTVGGQATVVRGTDGQIYTLGADGSYYAGSGISTMGGFPSQPYSSYSPGGIYPAGGTGPLTMPNATLPGTMAPRK